MPLDFMFNRDYDNIIKITLINSFSSVWSQVTSRDRKQSVTDLTQSCEASPDAEPLPVSFKPQNTIIQCFLSLNYPLVQALSVKHIK